MTTYETSPEMSYQQPDYWQGAYVFDIDASSGIALRGKVTHMNDTQNKSEYYYDYNSQIRRSLYMDNVLYTLSSSMIKMNDLTTIEEINSIKLPLETYYYPLYGVKEDIAVAGSTGAAEPAMIR